MKRWDSLISSFFISYLDRLGMVMIKYIHRHIRYGGYMTNKIRNYVNHYFRFDHREGIEDLKEEVISNLLERFYALIEEGNTEEEAYIKTIKQMGDFQAPENEEIPIEFQRTTPAIPEYALISSVIVSIFSTILLFIHPLTGVIFTATSIILYTIGSYYLYAKAMHVKSNMLDIELYKSYLKKIFTYMKTCFGFWSFNLAFVMAIIVQAITGFILGLMTATNVSSDSYQTFFYLFLILTILSFIVSFIVFAVLSVKLYQRLRHKYYLLTGESVIDSKIKESFDFIKEKDDSSMDKLKVITSFVGLFILGLGYLTSADVYNSDSMGSNPLITQVFKLIFSSFNEGIMLLFGLLSVIFGFAFYMKKKNPNFIIKGFIGHFVLTFIALIILSNPAKEINLQMNFVSEIMLLMPGLISILYYFTTLIMSLVKDKERRSRYVNYRNLYILIVLVPFLLFMFSVITITKNVDDSKRSMSYLVSTMDFSLGIYYFILTISSMISFTVLSIIGFKKKSYAIFALIPIVFVILNVLARVLILNDFKLSSPNITDFYLYVPLTYSLSYLIHWVIKDK